MKNKNTIRAILSLSFLLFAACKIEPIFYAIEKEVPLEKAVIKGNLYAMTEFNDKLYAASGSLYEKDKTAIREWKAVSAPGFIIRVASDKDNLYVLTEDKKLYTSKDAKDWTAVSITGSITELFDNKASDTAKTAYVTTSGDLCSLDGENTSSNVVNGEDGDKDSVAAVYDDKSSTVFSNTVLIASGENAVYTMDGNKIKYGTETSSIEVSGAKSMAVYNDGANEYLVIGTENGIEVIHLNDQGAPTTKGAWLGDNADSSFALVEIPTLYSFGDAIYAFAVDKTTSKKTKVWGYYTDRPEWNVE